MRSGTRTLQCLSGLGLALILSAGEVKAEKAKADVEEKSRPKASQVLPDSGSGPVSEAELQERKAKRERREKFWQDRRAETVAGDKKFAEGLKSKPKERRKAREVRMGKPAENENAGAPDASARGKSEGKAGKGKQP